MLEQYQAMATVGSFWFAATSFFVAVIVFGASIVGLKSTLIHSVEVRQLEAENKRLELNQRSLHNVIELVEIITGVSKLGKEGNPRTGLQLAAVEALNSYPEFYHLFPMLWRQFDGWNTALVDDRRDLLAAVERLIHKSKTN
jgi:hypothetical protein